MSEAAFKMIPMAFVAMSMVMPSAGSAEPWQKIGNQGALQFVSVPASLQSDMEMYEGAVATLCGADSFCKIIFFADRDSVSFPFTDADLAAQVADYSRNKITDLDRLMLACRIVTMPDPAHCFSID